MKLNIKQKIAAFTAIGIILLSGCAVPATSVVTTPPAGFSTPAQTPAAGTIIVTIPSLVTATITVPVLTEVIVPPPITIVSPAAMDIRPLASYSLDDFVGSGDCAACHTNLADRAGRDISIDTLWRATMMANSSKDPFWQASLAAEVEAAPGLRLVIEESCARCHMPVAHVDSMSHGNTIVITGEGYISPSNKLHTAALDGVSCALCHQITRTDLEIPYTAGTIFRIDRHAAPPDRVIFGPFPDPVTAPMRQAVGFTPTQSQHIADSRLCATCHAVYTWYADERGILAGTLPEQMPYLEWQQSAFYGNMSCLGCHMPQADTPAAIATPAAGLPERSPVTNHQFIGGNVFMLSLLKEHAAELGITASDHQIENDLAATREQLTERSASLTASGSLAGDTLTVDVDVTDLTGHKFPTGFPARQSWLHLTVKDSTGKVVFESGKLNADNSIAGNDADEDETAYEPHYDLITSPDQVQIYQSIMKTALGKVSYHASLSPGYHKDNRLLPRGFDKTKAPADCVVVGEALDDADFTGGSDRVTYRVKVPGNGSYTVTAELLYQPISYQFARALFKSDSSLVTKFKGLYDTADLTPERVAGAEVKIG